jgi:glutaryl-CoA dehydrogenase
MYNPPDYFRLEDLFSEEEKMARNTCRQFVDEKFIPDIARYHREGVFPVDLIPQLGEMGFLGATMPEEFGGAAMNNIAYGLIMQELERGDSSLRSFASVQSGLVIYPIFTFGSAEQKKKWLPGLIAGRKTGCFGLTEHDFGSNPGGMQTSASKIADGYVLNGIKMWITNGNIADIAVVWAKLDNRIRGFLVEKGTRGFSTNRVGGKFSLRASDTAELVLTDCEISEDCLLPESDGLKSPLKCLNQARYGIVWGALGAAMACYDEALQYAANRIQFGRPIAAYQLTQQKLVEMLTEITKAQLLAYHLGRLKDEGKLKAEQVSLAKRNNVYQALQIARQARSILGANGILDEYQVIRHLLNLETVFTYEGTHEIHTLIIGEDITGFSAF